MSILSTILLLFLVTETFPLFLRVETGHENIAISGRDPYYGHFTKINFQNLTCIRSINIHCLKELTGAEEIDLLYSDCEQGHWKVAHYTNSKNSFRLKQEIGVLRLLISSRDDLFIIDAQVEPCSVENTPRPSNCHRSSRIHGHRHGKSGGTIHAIDPYRSHRNKRAASLFRPPSEIMQKGTYDFNDDKIVPAESLLTVKPGAILNFAEGKGLIVEGKLYINGTSDEPVILDSLEGQWKGILFKNAEPGSFISHVKIYRANIGIETTGDNQPYLDHVLADGNGVGVRMRTITNATLTKMSKVTAVNSKGNGIELLGKTSR